MNDNEKRFNLYKETKCLLDSLITVKFQLISQNQFPDISSNSMKSLENVENLIAFICWEYPALIPYLLTLNVLPTLKKTFSEEQITQIFGNDLFKTRVSYIETFLRFMKLSPVNSSLIISISMIYANQWRRLDSSGDMVQLKNILR